MHCNEKYCIFRSSYVIATKLEIKDYYIMKKFLNPQNSKKVSFPLVIILGIQNNLPILLLYYPLHSKTHLMPGSLIIVNLVQV